MSHLSARPKVSILNWIRSGDFAGVFVGDSKERVHEILGAPRGCAGFANMGEIEDWRNSNACAWGYGIWTLAFEGNTLDMVCCDVTLREQYGWGVETELFGEPFFRGIDEAQEALGNACVPLRRIDERHYRVRDTVSGEVSERPRRFSVPTILAGEGLRTRIAFKEERGPMWILAHPFDAKSQTVSFQKLLKNQRFSLL